MENKKWVEFIIKSPIELEDIIYSVIYRYEIEAVEIIDYRTFLEIKEEKPYWIEIDDDIMEKSDEIIIKTYILESKDSNNIISSIKNELKKYNSSIDIL